MGIPLDGEKCDVGMYRGIQAITGEIRKGRHTWEKQIYLYVNTYIYIVIWKDGFKSWV